MPLNLSYDSSTCYVSFIYSFSLFIMTLVDETGVYLSLLFAMDELVVQLLKAYDVFINLRFNILLLFSSCSLVLASLP